MESAAVVRLALLFGSTWVVNAIVFSAVLVTVFLGNAWVRAGRAPALQTALIALLVSVALNYVVAPSSLVGLAAFVRVLASAALIGTPVLFAAVCFSRLFERQCPPGRRWV